MSSSEKLSYQMYFSLLNIFQIEYFQAQINELGLNIAYDSKNKMKVPKEFKGFVDYNRLVRLRNRFRY